MSYTRSSLYVGPARCVWDGASVYSRGNASLSIDRETFKVGSDAFGTLATRSKDVVVKCSFTPDGIWRDALLPKIYPYASTVPGTNIHGAVDVPLVLHTPMNELWTIVAAAITKMPDIILGNTRTMFGPMEFTGVRQNASEMTVADSLITFASTGGSFADVSYASADLKVQSYSAVWGAVAGFSEITAQDEWTISFDLAAAPITVPSVGTVMHLFQDVGVMVKCKPLGPTPLQVVNALKVQGEGALGHGQDLGQGDLILTGQSGVVISLYGAALVSAGFQFGTTVLRQGELGWVTNRSVIDGVMGPLWTMLE